MSNEKALKFFEGADLSTKGKIVDFYKKKLNKIIENLFNATEEETMSIFKKVQELNIAYQIVLYVKFENDVNYRKDFMSNFYEKFKDMDKNKLIENISCCK